LRKVIVVPEKTIFRQSAITAYKRRMEKDVVPHLISWPLIVCLWLLLGVFLGAGFFAWFAKVPTYVSGSGIMLASGDTLQSEYGNMVGIMFLPPDQSAQVRAGQPVDIQIGSTSTYIKGTIAQVVPGITSPATARQRYGLDGTSALLITQPSVVAIIKLDSAQPATIYAGSLLTARVQTGSQRLIALLLGSGQFLGGGS
jgi:hypothetical protein